MASNIRVRIAPSPTGEPHVGTAYTALFNYCLAHSANGKFLLRIEDTDQTRCTPGSEESIFKALRWLGLEWDEGPDIGGPFGPYRQSERLPIYKEHAMQLVEKGSAYFCFCTQERLAKMQEKQKAEKKNLGYDGCCRLIDPTEAGKRAHAGEPHVIRLKVEKSNNETTTFFDEIRQKDVTYNNIEIDDQILLKTDGFPTYHLANVVDDHLMRISHVIRAEEWIPSTPKHVMLYKAFGWDMPKFAHLSLLRNADKSKVSKRKNPVSLNWFRAAGYTKEAIINFLGLLGYSSGSASERFTISDMLNGFSLDRISTSSPVFDLEKLKTLNEEYIRGYSLDGYIQYMKDTIDFAARHLSPIMSEVQKRHKIGLGFNVWTDMFFKTELEYTANDFITKETNKKQVEDTLSALAKAIDAFGKKIPTAQDFEECIRIYTDTSGLDARSTLMTVRVAITGSQTSLPLYESMALIGKDRCVQRIKQAVAYVRSIR